jgi:hypothetical protein
MKKHISMIIAMLIIAVSTQSCMTSSGTCYGGYKEKRSYQRTYHSDPKTPKTLHKKQNKGLSYSSLFCR